MVGVGVNSSAVHAAEAYLPENFIQSFFDMVVWGHEHECKIDPIYNTEQGFYVIQPGSSVATSLSQGETVPKSNISTGGKFLIVDTSRSYLSLAKNFNSKKSN